MPQPLNLNEVEPETDAYTRGAKSNRDNSCRSGSTSVYFRNLVQHLRAQIEAADVVMGCVAWLTHPEILDALRGRNTAIVVQKEDFLRPDLGARSDWKRSLRARYDALRCEVSRFQFHNMVGTLDTSGDTRIEPVRCVGNFNRERAPAFPRMHNKFLVFAKLLDRGNTESIEPYAVWTGSFNLTLNATQSLENALLLEDPVIVEAYFEEFGQIMALSEPLDWTTDWSEPKWRIGT